MMAWGRRVRSETNRFCKKGPDHSEQRLCERKRASAIQQVEHAQKLPPCLPENSWVDYVRQDPIGAELGSLARTAREQRVDEIRTMHSGQSEEAWRLPSRLDELRTVRRIKQQFAQRGVSAVARPPEVFSSRGRAGREERTHDLESRFQFEIRTARESCVLHRRCA